MSRSAVQRGATIKVTANWQAETIQNTVCTALKGDDLLFQGNTAVPEKASQEIVMTVV